MKSSDSTLICQWVRSRKRMAVHLPTSPLHDENVPLPTVSTGRAPPSKGGACFSHTQLYSVVSSGFSEECQLEKPIYRGQCI